MSKKLTLVIHLPFPVRPDENRGELPWTMKNAIGTERAGACDSGSWPAVIIL